MRLISIVIMAKSKRGFAAMDPKKQREIARKGGEASHGGGRKKKSKSGRSRMSEW